jgi:hypothetical protein
MYAATMSDPKMSYIGKDHLFVGEEGMWVVWDVANNTGGALARLVKDNNGVPEGFNPVMEKERVCGYSHTKPKGKL